MNPLLVLFGSSFLIQILITYLSNLNYWPIRSMIRNQVFTITIYCFYQSNDNIYLSIPVITEIVMELNSFLLLPILKEKMLSHISIIKANAELEVARAKNLAVHEEAEARVRATKKMAEALELNDRLIDLELAKLDAEVEKEKARAMTAFANNPNALFTAEVARDYGRTRMGFKPQDYMPVITSLPGLNSIQARDSER